MTATDDMDVDPQSELLELEIGPVAHGGWCVARHDGRVVFVRHTLPAERVRARVVETTNRFWRAEAVEVLRASPDRVEPPCPYARPGRCGGCDWQHATPEAQRRLKAEVVREQLRRLAGLDLAVEVEELPGTPEHLRWRTRVRFAVDDDGRPGFRRHRSHRIEPVTHCPIAHPEVERAGVEGHRWSGTQEVEVVASVGTGDRLLLVTPVRGKRARVPRLDAPVRVVHGRPVPGPALPFVRERAAGREWRVSGGAFWQVHPAAAEVLADTVLEGLEPRAGDTVLDLYCGVGLFAGVLAERVGENGRVLGVESDPVAVRDARHNLADLPQVEIEQGRVEKVLDRVAVDRIDLVVLDPPRAGVPKQAVDAVAALAGRRIAYVSCDPATLARDLQRFGGHGWRVTGLRAFDAFPMTHHVECVAVLTR